MADLADPVTGSMIVMSSACTTKYMITRKSPAAMNVTLRSAAPGSVRSSIFMVPIAMTEHASPTSTVITGSATASAVLAASAAEVAPIAMVATIEPTYDSKISAPIPATSPTLSPTLSAMVAGLRGSSSGMPASTLPTRSAPTSAALVKMPPPTRANSAIDEAPMANPEMISAKRGSSGVPGIASAASRL